MSKITNISCYEIFNSDGTLTVETNLQLDNKYEFYGAAPRGSTVGQYEIDYNEIYDRGLNYSPRITNAISLFNKHIKKILIGRSITEINSLENEILITCKKYRIGNISISLSYALWKAYSFKMNMPMYKLFSKKINGYKKLNIKINPIFNIYDGSPHSSLKGVEILLLSKKELGLNELIKASHLFKTLELLLKEKGVNPYINKQGSITSELEDLNTILECINEAIIKEDLTLGNDYELGFDFANSDHFNGNDYQIPWNKKLNNYEDMVQWFKDYSKKYNISYVEDFFSDSDYENWECFMKEKGRYLIAGDDLFASNSKRLEKYKTCANTIVIKPNQIGTVTETIKTINLAKMFNYNIVISQRTGETNDLIISHLSMAVNNSYLKAGGLYRLDRVEKYNEILRYIDKGNKRR